MHQITNHKRYEQTFERLKKENRIGFCPFAVIGDPDEKEFLRRIEAYISARPDMLELGIPFSDPVADGPVIQAADERALKNGITPKKAINLIKKIRQIMEKQKLNSPIGILCYSNIVLSYGITNFYKDLKEAGADSVSIADVPFEEIKPFAGEAKKNKIHQIFLVSQYTDEKRLKKIEAVGSGFLYAVSVLGVTGARKKLSASTTNFIKKIKKLARLPIIVGFGISRPQHISALKKAGADAFIVGSALVKTKTSDLKKALRLLS